MIFRLIIFTALSLVVCSCGTSSGIERYSESKSHFMNPPVLMSHNYPDKDIYRIYHRGATGFVPVSALRSSAEQRAEEFCRRQGRTMQVLGEKRTLAFPLPGNFPAIEIIFAAVPPSITSQEGTDSARLLRLKKLHDEGLISDSEFESRKESYLNSGR